MHATIAGLGLIGGSIGMALRRAGWSVAFSDPAVTLEDALRAGAADARVEELAGPVIVLATPADVAVSLLPALRGSKSVVTSVVSVMSPLREVARDVHFIAGHPLAGSEKRGLAAARADLFAGKSWFIDREEESVLRMIRDCGAHPVVIDAAEHDRSLALTSHLPQVLSTALASLLDGVDERFIGSGARSILRLAGSSYDVWRPVLEMNRDNIEAATEALLRAMRDIDRETFSRAQNVYRKS